LTKNVKQPKKALYPVKTKNWLLIIGLSLLAMSFEAKSQSTNIFRLYKNAIVDLVDGNEHFSFRWRASLGDSIPEFLPASLDFKGHWGTPVDGLQVSLRFRRSEFLKGEEMPGVLIIRNLEPAERIFSITNGSGFYRGMSCTIICGTNGHVSLRAEEYKRFEKPDQDFSVQPTPIVGITRGFDLGSNCERIVILDLAKVFDLSKTGEYSAQARFPVFTVADGPAAFEVTSAPVKFKIVEKLSPAGVQEKREWENEMIDLQKRFEKSSAEKKKQAAMPNEPSRGQ
jgi:hypothetical protein